MSNIPLENLNFEDAVRELEMIVRRLEEGKTNLEEAIQAYERGAFLKKHCEKKLREAKMRVDQIMIDNDGTISTKPADFA